MHTRKIYLFIAFYIALVLAMGYAARNLRFDGSLESLLPHNNPHVLAFEQLKQLRSSEGGIEAVLKIKDDSLASMAEMSSSLSAFRGTSRDSLIQQLLVKKADDFERFIVQAKQEAALAVSVIEWQQDLHLLQPSIMYLMTEDELDGVYRSISEAIQAKKEEANPFYFSVEPDSMNQKDPSDVIAEFTRESMLLDYIDDAESYQLSTEEGTIKMRFLLSFTLEEFDALKTTIEKLDRLGEQWQQGNPTMEVYWGGNYIQHYNRFNNVTKAVRSALWIGLMALFGFLWMYMSKVGKGSDLPYVDILKDMGLMVGILLSGVLITLGIYSFISATLNLFVAIIFTEMGRYLDMFNDMLVFIACYAGGLYYFVDTYTWYGFWGLGLLSGYMHSLKSNIYEYYKGEFLHFSLTDSKNRNYSVEYIRENFDRTGFIRTITYPILVDYVKRQNKHKFRVDATTALFEKARAYKPEEFKDIYIEESRKLLALWAWVCGSNVMRNGLIISSLFGLMESQ